SVGGLLARAAHSPLSHGYGSLRDFCIGIQFVTGDGKLAKAGGRVVKNVTGYDLMKLMIGSQGTLGMIVSANFKVFPRPGQTRTFNMEFASLAEAIRFRDQMTQSALTPICLELISSRALEYLAAERIPARDPDDFRPTQPVNEKTSWRLVLRAAG